MSNRNDLKFGTTQEEQMAYSIFYKLLQDAKYKGINKPKTIYLSHEEELQSFIMWYALIQGLHIKYTNGDSYAE
jgi:hypothetical protein